MTSLRRESWERYQGRLSLALCLLLVLAVFGCGVQVQRPDMGYYFSHPLLNERWHDRQLKKRRVASSKKAKRASKKARKKSRKKVAAKQVAPPPAQELRGNELEVVRREMVLSAQRLVGIGESFSQDSFLRHLLIVNNLGLGEFPEEGVVGWLHQHAGKGAGTVTGLAAGDFLFLGDDQPEQCVVVEKVDGDGGVAFIGYLNGRVQRGVLSLTRRDVRRDESSKKVLNSFVGKTRLAGGLLLGSYQLDKHKEKLASHNP